MSSDNNTPEDNVVSLRPKLDPLKPMESHEWGRELYKSFLISSLGLPDLAADHKASVASKALMETISTAVLMVIGNVMENAHELEKEEIESRKSDTAVKQIAETIRLELVRQSDGVMWWDGADQELLKGGTPEPYGDGVLDRFDFIEVAKKVLE